MKAIKKSEQTTVVIRNESLSLNDKKNHTTRYFETRKAAAKFVKQNRKAVKEQGGTISSFPTFVTSA